MSELTVVLPTYNEAGSVGDVIRDVQTVMQGVHVEILVVDDDSSDGTADAARQAGARVIVRSEERGLGTAVVRGIQEASAPLVVVMDADGQHPAGAVRDLYDRAVATGADVVIGSRHIEGGDVGGFGPVRRVISGGAGLLSKICLPPVRKHRLTDPMSGLFLVRRDRIGLSDLDPKGYKILLEILAKNDLQRIEEIGYSFGDRTAGESKLGATVILQYLLHVLALGLSHPENRRILKFGTVGASGIGVNLGLLALLTEGMGLHYLASAVIGIEASILWNFNLNDMWTFRDRRRGHRLVRMLRFNLVSLLALVINLSTLAFLTEVVGLHYLVSELIAIVVTFTANYLGNLHWTYGDGKRSGRPDVPKWLRWAPWAIVVLGATGLLSDDLAHPPDIYFDEHYYVSVAYQANAGVWEDPCWENDGELDHRPLNFEHPPLAKLLILWSVQTIDPDHEVFEGCRDPDSRAYDDFTQDLRDNGDARAWRLPGALFGAAAIAFAGLAAGRLTGSPMAAAVASLLTATDGVLFTSSRMAILDPVTTGLATAALYAATFPNRRGVASAALLLALAFASKFTAVFIGPAVLAVILWSHWRAGRLVRRTLDRSLLALVLTPIPVLMLTYIPWWVRWIPEQGIGWAVKHWIDVQVAAVSWGASVQSGHAYASSPILWPALIRPVFYYRTGPAGGNVHPDSIVQHIYGVPNPVLWWATGLLLLLLSFDALADWRRSGTRFGEWLHGLPRVRATALFSLLLPLLAYAGFLALTRESFLFYTTILAPVLAIGLAAALLHLWRQEGPWGTVAAAAVVLLAVAAFIHYYPVLAAEPITQQRFEAIMGTIPWMRT